MTNTPKIRFFGLMLLALGGCASLEQPEFETAPYLKPTDVAEIGVHQSTSSAIRQVQAVTAPTVPPANETPPDTLPPVKPALTPTTTTPAKTTTKTTSTEDSPDALTKAKEKKPATLPTTVIPATAAGYSLDDLIRLTERSHPRYAQVSWAVDAARGRALQAGLYPNPTLEIRGDEIGDRAGPAGILTLPQLSQEIVRGNKLGLSQAVALKEVDQATLAIISERYRLYTLVRQNYWDAVTLQERAATLKELVALAGKSVENAQKLLKAKEGSELDVVQIEIDQERYQAELESTEKALPAAYRRLAASTGVNDLPIAALSGQLDSGLPNYQLEQAQAYLLAVHPDVRSAQIGIERAKLAIQRAEAEAVPNITIGANFIRQNQNRSNDFGLGASLPLPLWNKNQGGVQEAKAKLGDAINQVGRVQVDLTTQLATAFTGFSAAKARAEKYKSAIIPKSEQSLKLSQKAFDGGQFDSLRVLQAQRVIGEARLEYLRSLGEAWRSASDIAGLLLEDQWPLPTLPAAKP